MTLTFQGHVTRRHRSRDHSIPHGPFPICFFRQFFGKTRKHTLQTDRRQTDTTLQHKRDRYNGWTSVRMVTGWKDGELIVRLLRGWGVEWGRWLILVFVSYTIYAQHHDKHATVWSVRASGNVLTSDYTTW